MSNLTQGQNRGEFIVSEANGGRSRSVETLLTGENLEAGRVVAKITASGKYVAYDNVGADGSEVAAGIMYDNVDATAADKDAVILLRDAEVNLSELKWGAVDGAGQTAGIADLLALGIVTR